jgi:hypothetical protein
MNNKLTPEESFSKLTNNEFINEVKNWLKIDICFCEEDTIGSIQYKDNSDEIELRIDNSLNNDVLLNKAILLLIIIFFYCVRNGEIEIGQSDKGVCFDGGIIEQLENNDISEYYTYINYFLDCILNDEQEEK